MKGGWSGPGVPKTEALRRQAPGHWAGHLLSTPSTLLLRVTNVSAPRVETPPTPPWKMLFLSPRASVATLPCSLELQTSTLHPKAKTGKGLFLFVCFK